MKYTLIRFENSRRRYAVDRSLSRYGVLYTASCVSLGGYSPVSYIVNFPLSSSIPKHCSVYRRRKAIVDLNRP